MAMGICRVVSAMQVYLSLMAGADSPDDLPDRVTGALAGVISRRARVRLSESVSACNNVASPAATGEASSMSGNWYKREYKPSTGTSELPCFSRLSTEAPLVRDQEVAGSNPVSPIRKPLFCKPFRRSLSCTMIHTGTRLGTKLA
jgi:hypothetical protein